LEKEKWVLYPIYNNKPRIKVRPNTVLESFPPFFSLQNLSHREMRLPSPSTST